MASSQKFGRHSKRSPAAARYKAERRWEKSTRLGIERDKKMKEKNAVRVAAMKVPRGTARAERRARERATVVLAS